METNPLCFQRQCYPIETHTGILTLNSHSEHGCVASVLFYRVLLCYSIIPVMCCGSLSRAYNVHCLRTNPEFRQWSRTNPEKGRGKKMYFLLQLMCNLNYTDKIRGETVLDTPQLILRECNLSSTDCS
jgi:hypothetical protein